MIKMRPAQRICMFCAVIALAAAFGPRTMPVHAAPPVLWLPTPLGETWKVIQGFYCGTHTGSMGRALDLASAEGPTYGAPVRAAADGTTFVWDPRSGTIILSHGDGYYTEYTHLMSPFTTQPGVHVRQGDVIGRVGTIGTGNNPHLHFVFFTATGSYAANRTSREFNFADGYTFYDTSGCNQHYGERVVARGSDITPPEVHFNSEVQVNKWYCTAERIEFTVSDDRLVQGFSQAFNTDPGGETPEFPSDTGYVQLDWAGDGMHTLDIRAWDMQGNQTLNTFGPVGYDASPPRFTAPDPLPVVRQAARMPFTLTWQSADDGAGVGVRGYKLYFGPDPKGTSDWFSEKAEVSIGAMPPGRYVLRAQAMDAACGSSDWVTLQEVALVSGTESPATPMASNSPTPRPSATPKVEETPTHAATAAPSATATPKPARATHTATAAPSATATPKPARATHTATAAPSATATPKPERPTHTPTTALSPTPKGEETPTVTPTPASTRETRQPTHTSTPVSSPTEEAEDTPATVPTSTPTSRAEDTATLPPAPSRTQQPDVSPTATRTLLPTATRTPLPTAAGTPLPTPKRGNY